MHHESKIEQVLVELESWSCDPLLVGPARTAGGQVQMEDLHCVNWGGMKIAQRWQVILPRPFDPSSLPSRWFLWLLKIQEGSLDRDGSLRLMRQADRPCLQMIPPRSPELHLLQVRRVVVVLMRRLSFLPLLLSSNPIRPYETFPNVTDQVI